MLIKIFQEKVDLILCDIQRFCAKTQAKVKLVQLPASFPGGSTGQGFFKFYGENIYIH
jgi:hypothetical protein